jgi:uncharacterized membrane protein
VLGGGGDQKQGDTAWADADKGRGQGMLGDGNSFEVNIIVIIIIITIIINHHHHYHHNCHYYYQSSSSLSSLLSPSLLGVVGDGSSSATYLADMKQQQKDALLSLQESLAAEKSRQLQELEDRIHRRRQMHKRELAAAAAAAKALADKMKADPSIDQHEVDHHEMETKELEASMTAAAAESELQMVHVKEKSDALQEKLTSGLKKRFFYETKALKAKGSPLREVQMYMEICICINMIYFFIFIYRMSKSIHIPVCKYV